MINSTTYKSHEAIAMSLCSEARSIQRFVEGESKIFGSNPQYRLIVNGIMASVTVFANILILVALHKDSSLHPPSKLLFRCLSTTDLCVGLISQPLFVIYLMTIESKNWSICRITEGLAYASSSALCGESMSTLTAISVDRLLALLLGLRYREVVTLARVRLFVIISWITHLTFPLIYLWSKHVFFLWGSAWLFLCLVVSTCCYSKICQKLLHHQAQIQDQVHGGAHVLSGVNLARYRKSLSTALWIHSALVIFYLPYTITSTIIASGRLSLASTAIPVAGLLVFLNSMLNPLFYCWKMRGVRMAMRQTITGVFRCGQ